MFAGDLLNAGPMPALDMVVRFAGQRQRIIAHNIANIETPGFQPADVSPQSFQRMLGEAIEDRRRRTGGGHGELRWKETSELRRDDLGALRLSPETPSRNVLFHDRNNRDVERLMQDLAENAGAYRVAIDLMSHYKNQVHAALAERVA